MPFHRRAMSWQRREHKKNKDAAQQLFYLRLIMEFDRLFHFELDAVGSYEWDK